MAIVSHRARLLYISVPKVACTSIKSAFWALEHPGRRAPSILRKSLTKLGLRKPARVPGIHQRSGYETLSFARVKLPPEGYSKVVVVRDPLSRLISAWRDKVTVENFRRRNGEIHELQNALLPLNPTFSEFVHNYDKYRKCSRPARVHTELLSYHIGHDLQWYDRVFKLEDLSAFTQYVSNRLGEHFDLRRLNESASLNREFKIEDEDVAILRDLLAADYELLGNCYIFDESVARLRSA